MKIVLTGSLGNIGLPLTKELVKEKHAVTVISSNAERRSAIEALGAKAAIGSMFDAEFLAAAFQGADVVYLMETLDAAGGFFDKDVDFIASINQIGHNYKNAVMQSGVKKVVHLSSVGAHTNVGTGILIFHRNVEAILNELPANVAIKFIRPVGFYTNMRSWIKSIRNKGAIVSNYGGDQKEPWVAPLDIAKAITEAINTPFEGRTIRYVASDEVSPNEVAKALGAAIGKPGLQWQVISDEQLLSNWLGIGFNEQIANGFVEFQASMGTGALYEDYYRNKPLLGEVKLADFAKEFALML